MEHLKCQYCNPFGGTNNEPNNRTYNIRTYNSSDFNPFRGINYIN